MDWRAFAKKLLLADGKIDEMEATLLKRAILEDGKVDREEIEFLIELKREARQFHPTVDHLLFGVLEKVVLQDGKVDDAEALWLREILFADNVLTNEEAAFLKHLKDQSRSHGKEFDRLLQDCVRLGHRELA